MPGEGPEKLAPAAWLRAKGESNDHNTKLYPRGNIRFLRVTTTKNAIAILLCLVLLIPAVQGQASGEANLPGVHTFLPTTSEAGLYLLNLSKNSHFDFSGISANVTTFTMPAYHGNGSAAIDVAVNLDTRGETISVGMEANSTMNDSLVYADATIFNTTTYASYGFALGSSLPVGSLTNLAIVPSEGNTWACYVDGEMLLNSTLPAMSGALVVNTTILTAWNGTSWLPEEVFMPQAMELRTHSGWVLPQPVYAYAEPLGARPFDIAGELQNPSLAPGEFVAGTNATSSFDGGTVIKLWGTAQTTHAALDGAVSPSEITGGQNLSVSWRTTNATGSPIVGAQVMFWSNLGGVVGDAVSNYAGWANCSYSTIVVQQVEIIYLNASLEAASYYGWGSLTAKLFPVKPIPLTVSLTPHIITGASSGMVEIVVLVRQNANPVAGVGLLPEASVGGGVFSPPAPWVTNSVGYLYMNYTVPDIHGNVTVWVNVSNLGYSGSGNLTIVVNSGHTQPGATSPMSGLWPYVVGGVLAAVVVVILVVLFARKRGAKEEAEPSTDESAEPSSDAKEPNKKPTTK